MKKILVFAGSNSKKSINKEFAYFVADFLRQHPCTLLDINDFPLPIYSIDREETVGFPDNAQKFKSILTDHNAYVISLPEHNGSYSAVFKNLLDWLSRINRDVWQQKPMFLMSASPGGRGGKGVFDAAKATFPRLGANIVATFSLPSFYQNFSGEDISNQPLKDQLMTQLQTFKQHLDA